MVEVVGQLVGMGDDRTAFMVATRRSESKKRVGRPRHRWADHVQA